MIENAPVLVQKLDALSAAMAPGDTAAEMAFWEQACQLGIWYVVNRGTEEAPQPSGFEIPGVGNVLGVYSTRERAGAVAGEGGAFVGVPMPQVLDWLASFGEHGVRGIVMDHPGPWIPLPNLSYLKRWVPAEGFASIGDPRVVAAPRTQAAMEAYLVAQSDAAYEEVIRALASENVLVVLDPQGDGTALSHVVNHRGEKVLLGFTDSTRALGMLEGKAADIQERPAAEVLTMVGPEFDVLILDPQHPASFAATPEWIRVTLGGAEAALAGSPAPAEEPRKRSRFGFRR
ncbi:SseB family protein [Nocardioides montaniterrae]